MIARSLALAFALATCGAALIAQDTTFKTGTRTVAVYTTVTDPGGRLVPDLARGDFEVDDNGKHQELTGFANDIQPITVVLMLDRSGSMQAQFRLVEQAAEEFVAAMQPADKARIGSFSNRIQVDPRDFTSNHDDLVSVLRHELQEAGPTPLWNAVNVGITALLHQQGRRVVIIFTDGMDNPANGSANNNSLKDVMKRAEQEDVMVYAIGLTGQITPPGPGGGYGGRPGGFGGRGRGGYGGSYGGGRPVMADKPDEGLPQIAGATGGGYFELKSTDDLPSTFRRVVDELHHQYVLGFAPTNLDGKMHNLTVRVKGGLTARARRSYLATADRG
jgi:VWFA-related protein